MSRASASARSHRNNILFFASSCARCYPTVTAPSHHTTSYPFDRDIKYVIVDASLLRCRVATSGRGCRPQALIFNEINRRARRPSQPPPTLQSSYHLRAAIYNYGQHTQRAHSCGGGFCLPKTEVIILLFYIIYFIFNTMLTPYPPSSLVSQPPQQACRRSRRGRGGGFAGGGGCRDDGGRGS